MAASEPPHLLLSFAALATEAARRTQLAYWEAVSFAIGPEPILAAQSAVHTRERAVTSDCFRDLSARWAGEVTEEHRVAVFQEIARRVVSAGEAELTFQSNLLRDLCQFDFSRSSSNAKCSSAVHDLAVAAYSGENVSFALHDALLESGQDGVADHFLESTHFKGCWALDLLMGKQ